ncbi:hypothetical protein [Bradyrhizobium sp. UFLA05-112]
MKSRSDAAASDYRALPTDQFDMNHDAAAGVYENLSRSRSLRFTSGREGFTAAPTLNCAETIFDSKSPPLMLIAWTHEFVTAARPIDHFVHQRFRAPRRRLLYGNLLRATCIGVQNPREVNTGFFLPEYLSMIGPH